MSKTELMALVGRRLDELRGKRSRLPEDDLLTVFQYVHGTLSERFTTQQIGDTDSTQSGDGRPEDALSRLMETNSEKKIISAIIDRGGSPDLRIKGVSREQYENAVKEILHDLQGEKTPQL